MSDTDEGNSEEPDVGDDVGDTESDRELVRKVRRILEDGVEPEDIAEGLKLPLGLVEAIKEYYDYQRSHQAERRAAEARPYPFLRSFLDPRGQATGDEALNEFEKFLNENERAFARADWKLQNRLREQISLWERITGSPRSMLRKAVRHSEDEEEDR